MEEFGVKCLCLAGESLLHVSICCKSLINHRHLAKVTDVKQAVTSSLQTLDNDFHCTRLEALVSRWEKCLNVSGDYEKIWCVPSATHAQCMQWSQNKVLGIRIFNTLFSEASITFKSSSLCMRKEHTNHIYSEYWPCLIKWLGGTRVNEKFTRCWEKARSVAAAWLTMVIWQHKFLPFMVQSFAVHSE